MSSVTLLVNGINCGGCASSLKDAFAAADIEVVSITTKKESGEHPNPVVVKATLAAAKEAVVAADKGRGKFTVEEAKEAAHDHGHSGGGGGGCCGQEHDHGHAEHDHGHAEAHDHGHAEAHDHSHEGGGGCGGGCAKDDDADMPPRMRAAAAKRKAAEEAAANGHAHGHGGE
tara:strand:- start:415 stop:930 length:516 start_codon:yes stop_codon:yes gene_type:complete